MKKNIMAVTLCLAISLTMSLSLWGCGKPAQGVKPLGEETENAAGNRSSVETGGRMSGGTTMLSYDGIAGKGTDNAEAGVAESGTAGGSREITEEEEVAVTDFAVRLFWQSLQDKENTLISPVSVLYALAITANGAKGETLSQMEEVLGLKTSDLNVCLNTYIKRLPADEKYKLSLANSIWFKDDKKFTVEQDFLRTNAQ